MNILTKMSLFALALHMIEFLTACGRDEKFRGRTVVLEESQGSADAIGEHVDEHIHAEDEKPSNTADETLALAPAIGIRNFVQINDAFAKITGVVKTTPAIRTLYETDLRSALPTTSDITSFLPSHQVAISKLATEYCDALINDPAKRGAVIGTFNIAGLPATLADAQQARAISTAMLGTLWGLENSQQPDRTDSIDTMTSLVQTLAQTDTSANNAGTLAVVKGACSAVLSSSIVTTY
jgi:hypothetical protein